LLKGEEARKGVSPFLFRDIHKYFAHTNSAKCKDADRKSGQGPPLVFNNCRKFIAPEIEPLRPDILVTQTRPAARRLSDEHRQAARELYEGGVAVNTVRRYLRQPVAAGVHRLGVAIRQRALV
jgi:hypothetical protein